MLKEIDYSIPGDVPSRSTGARQSSSHSVRILRTVEEVESVREVWERWQNHPNSDIDFFLLLCRIRDNVRRPHVVMVFDGTEACALLAARVEDGHIAPNIGYMKPIRLAVKRLAVLYEGFLGRIDAAVATAMLNSLEDSLKRHEADILEFYYLPEDSALLRSALGGAFRLWRDGRPAWSTHWELTLPEQPGGLVREMKSKHRSWISRKVRELDTAFPQRVTYRSFSRSGDVLALCSELEQVACLTYQRGLGEGFANDLEHQERFTLFHRRGALRAWTLRLDEKPRAFCLGFVYGSTFYFSETGYDATLRAHEIGTLTFLYMIDELIKEGVTKFNFGFGDAHYKERFGDRSWKEGTLRLYRRSVKGLVARLYAGCFDATTGMARAILRRLKLFDKLKVAWRKRLAAQAKTKAKEDPASK